VDRTLSRSTPQVCSKGQGDAGRVGQARGGRGMIEFVQVYGLWIVLGIVFLTMHLFGMECCHRRGNNAGRIGPTESTGKGDPEERSGS
jgi:hypothetical protein